MKKSTKQTFTQNSDGTEDLSVTCTTCGKPIVKTTKFGMFCENKCGLKESKKAHKKLKDILGGFGDMFDK